MGIAGEIGPAQGFVNDQFDGQLRDLGAQLSLGWTHPLARVLSVGVSGVLALHVNSLSGSVKPTQTDVDRTRTNLALLASVEAQLHAGPLSFYLQPSAGAWLQRQRYVVLGDTVARTPRLATRAVAGLLVKW